MNEDLENYIREQLLTGVEGESLKKRLLEAGWDKTSIDEAFPKTQETPQPDSSSHPQKLSSPIELLKQTWEFYKKGFKVFTLILLIPVIANIVLGSLLIFSGATGLLAYSADFFQNLKSSQPTFWGIIFVGIILFVVFLLLQTLGQTALLVAIAKGEGVKASLKKGFGLIIPYCWVMTLSALVIGGGLMLFVIPGMIFSIWFSLDIFVLADEGVGGMTALVKSKNYVEGKWWATLGRIAFIGVVTIMVLSIPGYIFEKMNLGFLATFYSVLGSLIWVPILLIYNYLLYKNLREIAKEKAIKKSSKILFLVIGFLGLAIPILTMIILATLNPSGTLQKAKDAQKEANGKMFVNTLNYYYADYGVYPETLDQLSPDYISEDLKDTTKEDFDYQVFSDGQRYQFCIEYQEKERECVSSPPNIIPQENLPV